MKKIFEKLISSSTKPEMYLGFSGTTLKWVVSSGKKDSQGRVVIDDLGTITNFAGLPKNLLPVVFKKYLRTSTVHMVLPAAVCQHLLIPEKINQVDVKNYAPNHVVYQKLLTSTASQQVYATASIDMQALHPQQQVLLEKDIAPDHVHHIAVSFTRGNNGEASQCIVSFGEVFTWIAWVCADEILYQEDLPIGKQHIINIIEKTLNVSSSQAQKILEKYGITQSHPDTSVLATLHQTLRPITDTINTWILEHSQFTYIKHPFQNLPKNILLTGSSGDIAGLAQFLVLQTGISAEIFKGKLLQHYTLKHDHHISDLIDYEPLISMIKR
jgi:hypothetical protein